MRDTLAYITRVDRELQLTPQTPIASTMASMRLRMLIPGAELAHRANVRLVPLARFLEDPALAAHANVRAVVIGKLSVGEVKALGDAGRDRVFAALARCPHPLFADFSDNYPAFGGPDEARLLDYQSRMGAAATLTVPCRALADGIGPQAKRGIHVVEDPYESPERPIRFAPPDDELRLCWFGAAYEPRVPYGTPVYEHDKALVTRRYFPDEDDLAGELREHVTREGGATFFARPTSSTGTSWTNGIAAARATFLKN